MQKVNSFTNTQSPSVDIGARIEIEVNGELQSWEIVDPGESDIRQGRISCQAPLIQCILGARKGDKIKCKIIDRDFSVTIKNTQMFTKLTEHCILSPLLL